MRIKGLENLKGQLTITRRQSASDRQDVMALRVEDDAANLQFLELEIPLAEFMQALTGLACVDCTIIDLYTGPNLGKVFETKSETLVFGRTVYTGNTHNWDELVTAAVKPYLVDGWQVHANDLTQNHHKIKYVEDKTHFNVSFHRWVDKPVA